MDKGGNVHVNGLNEIVNFYEDKRIAELTRDFLKENDWDKEVLGLD